VLFMSGYANLASPVDTAAHVNFLTKPFQGSELLAKVRKVLG
jgi:hypothetical protein